MFSDNRSDQIFGGVILIGLGILFVTGWWFPGMLFVISAAMFARSYATDEPLTKNTGALILFAIGLFFVFGDVAGAILSFNWIALLFILGGLYLIFKDRIISR